MRQLRTCDFCGDDSVGTFEIVPSELNPTEAEQRRIVLCADCQPTLEELLEPLLARAGAVGADPETTEQAAEDQTDDTPDESESSNSLLADDGDETGSNGAADRDRESGDAERADRGTPGIEAEPDDDAPNGVISPEQPNPTTDDDEGVAIRPGGDGRGRDASDRRSAAADDATAVGASPNGATQASGSKPASAPKAYRKVLRLLQNREFPMARADVETLAAGAYDLEDHEAEAIIDHAVEQGDLVGEGRNVRLG